MTENDQRMLVFAKAYGELVNQRANIIIEIEDLDPLIDGSYKRYNELYVQYVRIVSELLERAEVFGAYALGMDVVEARLKI